ncbi:hypothetical protein JYU34_019041 [Plutella xylostella]|uniref:Retrotransposon gag domain-containing protein n=1 Tax=Plutella xylostella TaxID=51655 RepID=A0ABQ7PZ13_PLUXY|nr:hypothetical protein JYU34_019041 [Plutella xylostella]
MYAIKFLSLQKSELEYEVAIRGTTPCSKVADLRKQIVKLVSEYPSEEVLESPFDVVEDLTGCLEVLGKVEKILQEPQPDIAVVKRAENLLNHLYHRLHRIAPTEESKVQYDETLSLYKNFVGQFRSFLEKGVDTLSMCSSSQETASDQLGTPVINVTCDRSSILDLGKIKFDGDTCVRAFIERVSEYCSARNISDARLLSFGTEIFTGNALHWFRSVRDQVSSWDELKALLRQDFDTLDFDYRLLAEIRARTQGESENITIYLSIISGMFSRLSKSLPEEDKLEIILHNIRPCYASTLASSTEIKSIEQLRTLCRNYETFQCRLNNFREPTGVTRETLAPEFAYTSSSNKKTNYNTNNHFKSGTYNDNNKNYGYRNYNNNNNVQNANKTSNNTLNKSNIQEYVHAIDEKKPLFCPRCRENTHNLRQCRNPDRSIICFKCGHKGVKYPDCPECQAATNNPSNSKN